MELNNNTSQLEQSMYSSPGYMTSLGSPYTNPTPSCSSSTYSVDDAFGMFLSTATYLSMDTFKEEACQPYVKPTAPIEEQEKGPEGDQGHLPAFDLLSPGQVADEEGSYDAGNASTGSRLNDFKMMSLNNQRSDILSSPEYTDSACSQKLLNTPANPMMQCQYTKLEPAQPLQVTDPQNPLSCASFEFQRKLDEVNEYIQEEAEKHNWNLESQPQTIHTPEVKPFTSPQPSSTLSRALDDKTNHGISSTGTIRSTPQLPPPAKKQRRLIQAENEVNYRDFQFCKHH